jgi:hypothetical protein
MSTISAERVLILQPQPRLRGSSKCSAAKLCNSMTTSSLEAWDASRFSVSLLLVRCVQKNFVYLKLRQPMFDGGNQKFAF